MSAIKQQHYVPQFYLRNFCDAAGRIHVYDKLKDVCFATNPQNVAGERYFYDCEEMASVFGDKQAVEKYLSALEGEFSPRMERLLDRLKTNNFIRLHHETRAAIAVFTAFQLVRSKETRVTARQMGEQMLKFMSRFPGAPQIDEIKQSLTEEEQISAHCRRLLDIPSILQFANIMENHIWIIKRRHVSGGFWTSDDPIAKKDNIRDPFRSNAGIASPGVEIHVPLSPDFKVVLYERTYFKRLTDLDGKIVDLKVTENVPYYRQFQVRESLRFIFSNDADFSFAKKMCDEEPIWRDPNRKRVTSNHDED